MDTESGETPGREMTRSLTVWWDGVVVGRLVLDRHGAMRFAYDSDWVADPARPPVSFSLPKRPESFSARLCAPFFEGLLPEGSQRDAVAVALGVSSANTFRLLVALGEEVAGALTLCAEGEVPSVPEADGGRILSDDELVELLDTIRTRPFLAGREEGLRLSLAGAQSKLPVVVTGDGIAVPSPGQPTTHILKPPIPGLAATTENEAFAMRLAAGLGLKVALAEARVVSGRPFLLVERYDRRVGADGEVRRLHQEDFCQALGVPSARKYASDGGPGFARCFDLLRRTCTPPAPAVLELLDAAIVQVLIGNADAHGKNYSINYSILHDPLGAATLAPLYDLMCTVEYPHLAATLAMKIGRRGTLREFRPGTWDRFARDCGLSAPFVRRRVRELCEMARERCEEVAAELACPGLDEEALHGFAARIAERAGGLAGTTRPAGPRP